MATNPYIPLPILLPQALSFPTTTKTTHTLYIRRNQPKIPIEKDSRSLFVVNLPIDAEERGVRGVFNGLLGNSRVEGVEFSGHKGKGGENEKGIVRIGGERKGNGQGKKRKRGVVDEEDVQELEEAVVELPDTWGRELHGHNGGTGTGTAVITFVDERSLEGVLKGARKMGKLLKSKGEGKSKKDTGIPVWGEGIPEGKVPALGSERYSTHHILRYPDPATLKSNVDAYMTWFNALETLKKEKEKRGRNEPDEDGFVTVTRGGRVGPARREDVEQKRKEMEEKEEKARKEREEKGFYRFQVRERKKVEQAELVRRFEEDRRRVEGMRERRGKKGFRPES